MIGGIGNMLFSTYSQTSKCERSKGFFGEPLKHVITPRGQILVSSIDDDTPAPPCGHSKRPPCVPAPRAHVFQHVRVVPAYTGTFLNVHTEARVEATYGVFPAFFHTVPQHTHKHDHSHKHSHSHNDTHHRPHNRYHDAQRHT